MPITVEEIAEHRKQHGIGDIPLINIDEYKHLLQNHAFFYSDAHGFIRSSFTDEIFATTREQVDAIIELFQDYKNKMD